MGMAYAGSTQVSTAQNPPMRIAGGLGAPNEVSTAYGGGRGVWLYNSSNPTTDMSVAGFFTDARNLGMRMGDIVLGAVGTGSSVSVFVGVLSSLTTAGAANLASSGGILSSTR